MATIKSKEITYTRPDYEAEVYRPVTEEITYFDTTQEERDAIATTTNILMHLSGQLATMGEESFTTDSQGIEFTKERLFTISMDLMALWADMKHDSQFK